MELVSNFSEVGWIYYEFSKFNLFSEKEKGVLNLGVTRGALGLGKAATVNDRWG